MFIDQTHARGDALHTENTQRSKSNKVEIYEIEDGEIAEVDYISFTPACTPPVSPRGAFSEVE